MTIMGEPLLRKGEARLCMLRIENNSDKVMNGTVSAEVDGCLESRCVPFAMVNPHTSIEVPFTVWSPMTYDAVEKDNYVTVLFEGLMTTFYIQTSNLFLEKHDH